MQSIANYYGDLTEHEEGIRNRIKTHFSELKEKQIKDLLDRKTWESQKQILLKARQLQQAIGTAQHDDMNGYDDVIKATRHQPWMPKRKNRSPMP